MPPKNTFARPEDEEMAKVVSRRVSRLIMLVLSESKFTQKSFAKELGVSRVTLNQILRSGAPDSNSKREYSFRLPILCAVARALNTSVAALLSAADAYSNGDTHPLDELKRRASELPFSRDLSERLRERIAHMMNLYFTFFPQRKGKRPIEREDYESAYRCSVMEIEQGVPSFWNTYSVGLMSDNEVDDLLGKAIAYAEGNGGLESVPFWIALKAVVES